jgi:outer membrane protein TolC
MAVLLADLEQSWTIEVMAMKYVHLSRTRDYLEAGRSNRTALLQSEVAYAGARMNNQQRESQQQLTRLALARLLNRLEHPPERLLGVPLQPHAVPEVEALVADLRRVNPQLYIAKQRAKAAHLAYRISRGVLATGSLLRTEFTQASEGDTVWSLTWVVPLWQPERTLQQQQLHLQKTQQALAIRSQQQQLHAELVTLQASLTHLHRRYRLSQSTLLYREVALDDSRARYELEMNSHLGDSMVDVSEAQWASKKSLYALLLAQEKLRILRGEGLCGE